MSGLAEVLLVLNVAQTWLREICRVTLRDGPVHDLMSEWLKPLRALRRARAELRFSLVRVDKEIESVTIQGDEADELDYLNRLFESVLEVSRRLVRVITRLTWITAGDGGSPRAHRLGATSCQRWFTVRQRPFRLARLLMGDASLSVALSQATHLELREIEMTGTATHASRQRQSFSRGGESREWPAGRIAPGRRLQTGRGVFHRTCSAPRRGNDRLHDRAGARESAAVRGAFRDAADYGRSG